MWLSMSYFARVFLSRLFLDLQFIVLSDVHFIRISISVFVRYVWRATSRCCLFVSDHHVFVVGFFFVLVMVDRHSAGARYLRYPVPRIYTGLLPIFHCWPSTPRWHWQDEGQMFSNTRKISESIILGVLEPHK